MKIICFMQKFCRSLAHCHIIVVTVCLYGFAVMDSIVDIKKLLIETVCMLVASYIS